MLTEELARLALKKCAAAPIVGILSCDLYGIIGREGKTPWRIPDELKFFQAVVREGSLIMGRKTFESMPASILKGKINTVFSRKPHKNIPGVTFVSSMQGFRELDLPNEASLWFMVGGAQVTQLFLEAGLISKFILSKINGAYEGDTSIDLSVFTGWKSEVIYQSEIYTTEILARHT